VPRQTSAVATRLVITGGAKEGLQIDLPDEILSIGRSSDSGLVVRDDYTSTNHARLVRSDTGWILEDLDSTNGTQVNGQPVTKHPLAHGDVVTIGRNTLRYFTTGDAADADNDRTMMLRPGTAGMAALKTAAPPSRPAPSIDPSLTNAGKPVLGRLRLTSGPNQGREMELSKPLTTLGKPGVQVAAITRRAEGYYIVQVDSTGGRKLRINGTDVEPQPRRLADRDRIELAGTQMEFVIVS
jgi:pSer/pThr/pTyr-binding forkhead associated (FHA) protein